MSATGGGRQRPVFLWYLGAVAVAGVIAGLAYYVLVVREQANAVKARKTVENLDEEVSRARAYLGRHQNDPELKKRVDSMQAEVKRRIPQGPIDVVVGSYFDQQAKEAHIEDLKWSFSGGIKPPAAPGKPDEDRLAADPAKLNASVVDVVFTARYKEALKFIRALSPEKDAAPWPIELKSLEVRRIDARDSTASSGKVHVKLVARYFYQ